MTTQIEQNTLQMEFTAPEKLHFYRNPQGFLALDLDDKSYPRVQLRRALPFSDPARWVCVTDMDDNELALIEDIAALGDNQRGLVCAELDLRYYYPVVTEIKSIKEKMGTYYFEVSIGGHEKNAAVKDISKNLRTLSGGTVVLTDVDGNRFLIPDVYAVKKKILRRLEAYLY